MHSAVYHFCCLKVHRSVALSASMTCDHHCYLVSELFVVPNGIPHYQFIFKVTDLFCMQRLAKGKLYKELLNIVTLFLVVRDKKAPL